MMDQLFGAPNNERIDAAKRLKWALDQYDQPHEPIPHREELENQLIRGKLPDLSDLLPLCQQLSINLDWVFFNHGQPFRAERQDHELREMINFANQRKEFRHSLLAKFYELRALYRV
jgi:hypothetical protein